jgi:formylglycine-generating enzyme required for sulfatase activity
MSEHFDPYYVWLGIAPKEQPPNHYRLLGIDAFEDHREVIENAADQKVIHLRTFQLSKHRELAEKLLNQVATAKICLLNSAQKAAYDQQLHKALDAPAPVAAAAVPASSPASAKSPGPAWLLPALGAAAVLAVLGGVLGWLLSGGNRPASPAGQVASATPARVAQEPSRPKPATDRPAPVASPPQPEASQPPMAKPTPQPRLEPKAPPRESPKVAATPAAKETKGPPAEEAEPAPVPMPARLPAPSPEACEKALTVVQETYKEQYAQARSPAEKQALANKLLDKARQTAGDPAARYVLLQSAHAVAVRAGDGAAAMEMADEMARLYEVDVLEMKAQAVGAMLTAARTAAQQKLAIQRAQALMDEAVHENQPEAVKKLGQQLTSLAHKNRDDDLLKSLSAFSKRAKERAAAEQKFQQAQETLKESPDDAVANLAAGRYLCLVQGDWAHGLPHLAKGSDPVMSKAAATELSAPPQDAAGQAQLADAWWGLARSRRPPERDLLLVRADWWYEQARGAAPAGPLKARVEERLADIASAVKLETLPVWHEQPSRAAAPFDEKRAKFHQKRWSGYLHLPVVKTNSIGMSLVLIPPGEFDMGSTPEEVARYLEIGKKTNQPKWWFDTISGEGPQHRVKITRPFYLGMYQVTQVEYEKVMGVNPSAFTEHQMDLSGFSPPLSEEIASVRPDYRKRATGMNTSRHPVDSVSWDDATEFCRRLSAMPAERAAGRVYHLPTEAEWEYACRAGTTTRWYCGDDEAALREFTWLGEIAHGMTHPVGEKKPNAWGLYDMHGNVYQWCADRFSKDYYQQSPPSDPAGPRAGSARVMRGGTWLFPASRGRSASRVPYGAVLRNHAFGFRVVADTIAAEPAGNKPETPARPGKAADSSAPPPATAPFDAPRAKQHQQRWAEHLGVTVEEINSIGTKLVLIPPGQFDLGSADDEIACAKTKNSDSRYAFTRHRPALENMPRCGQDTEGPYYERP